MHVLILTNYWPPEIGASPHLTFELAESLAGLGHRVSVVTGFPRYNVVASGLVKSTPGVTVSRIRTPRTSGVSNVRRGIGHLLVAPLYGLRSLPLRRVDVVYTVSPPLPMGLAAWAAARRFRTQYCLGVQDLFPQNAIDLGVLRSCTAIRFFERMERFVYARAGAITVHSEGNQAHVAARTAHREKVHVLPNWVDTDRIRPGERRNGFREAAGLDSEFVVLFAGTMGWSQGLGVVIDAARLLAEEPALAFLLVGDGTEKPRLAAQAAGLRNVRFLPMQTKEAYPNVLASADACLVTLAREVRTPVVPSKLLTIMAAGRPVLASLPLSGDAPRIIESARCGLAVEAGDSRALADAVLALERDPERARALAANGRRYAEERFSRPACVRGFEKVLTEIAKRSHE